MKKLTLLLIILSFGVFDLYAQNEKKEFTPGGKVFAKVFWNYHYNLTPDVNQVSAFEIQRSYLGHKYALSKNISTKITFDVGKNDGGSAYTAFLKTAQLDWKMSSSLKLSLGLIGLKQWNDQEKFWGYRYIYKSFQDQHKFGSSADLGANAEIKLSDMFALNFLVINGGGYKNLQDDFGMHRVGANVIVKPVKKFTFKVYYDLMPGKEYDAIDNTLIVSSPTITNLAFFAGYKSKSFRLAGELNQLSNGKKYTAPVKNHKLSGISIYSTYVINKKTELFGRFDKLTSNKISGDVYNWNNSKDGSSVLAGVQFSPVKGLKTALNYRIWMFADSDKDNTSLVYINFEYKY